MTHNVFLEKIEEPPIIVKYSGFVLSKTNEFDNVFIIDDEDKPLINTEVLELERYRLIGRATTEKIFNSLSQNLDDLVVTEEQILRFSDQNKNLIRPNKQKSLLFAKNNNEYYVYSICLYSVMKETLNLYIRKLNDTFVYGLYADEEIFIYVPHLA